MAVLTTNSPRAQFSILQLVGLNSPPPTDFESMEDVQDLTHLAPGSTVVPVPNASRSSRVPVSSINCSFHSPLVHSSQSHSRSRTLLSSQSRTRSNLGHNVDLNTPLDATNRPAISFHILPTRSKSLNGHPSKPPKAPWGMSHEPQLPIVDEVLASSPASQRAHVYPEAHRFTLDSPSAAPCVGSSVHMRRTSLDLGHNVMHTGIRHLKRSSSMWVTPTGDKSSPFGAGATDTNIRHIRAEPQMSEQQKLVALKRARKIAQVFGSEAPADLVHGSDPRCPPTNHTRDSSFDIISSDTSPLAASIRRSNFDPSTSIFETKRQTSNTDVSLNPNLSSSKPSSEISIEFSEISHHHLSTPTSATFRERRKRAAKLTQFFGVNYNDISQSIAQSLILSSLPKPDNAVSRIDIPTVEVDVKVAGRRFWGRADGEMKTAEVADVIDKLRVLKAA